MIMISPKADLETWKRWAAHAQRAALRRCLADCAPAALACRDRGLRELAKGGV